METPGHGGAVVLDPNPRGTSHLAWAAMLIVLVLASLLLLTLQVARFTASRARTHAAPQESATGQASDRAVLPPDLERRRIEIQTWGESLEQEHREIEAEEGALDTLHYRIESRRRRYPDGFSAEAQADDDLEVLDYNHRLTVLKTRIISYNTRVDEYRQAVAEFDRLASPDNGTKP